MVNVDAPLGPLLDTCNNKLLFSIISGIITPATLTAAILSNKECQCFLSFFVDKVKNVRNNFFLSICVDGSHTSQPVILV